MIITQTFRVGGNTYRTGVGKNGKKWQSQSFKAYPFEQYVSIMLPEFIHENMLITVSGTVKKTVDGQYTNYNLVFPVIDIIREYDKEQSQASGINNYSEPVSQDDVDQFSGGNPIDISDDDLPF